MKRLGCACGKGKCLLGSPFRNGKFVSELFPAMMSLVSMYSLNSSGTWRMKTCVKKACWALLYMVVGYPGVLYLPSHLILTKILWSGCCYSHFIKWRCGDFLKEFFFVDLPSFCWFAIHSSSLVKCLFKSFAHFFIGLSSYLVARIF